MLEARERKKIKDETVVREREDWALILEFSESWRVKELEVMTALDWTQNWKKGNLSQNETYHLNFLFNGKMVEYGIGWCLKEVRAAARIDWQASGLIDHLPICGSHHDSGCWSDGESPSQMFVQTAES